MRLRQSLRQARYSYHCHRDTPQLRLRQLAKISFDPHPAYDNEILQVLPI